MSKPTFVFVCVHNAGKSQMAAAIARVELSEHIDVMSAGTHPGSDLNSEAKVAVEEIGYNMTGEYPKLLTPEIIQTASRIIILGDEAQVEADVEMAPKIIRWEVSKPDSSKFEKLEQTRIVRDEIVDRINSLKLEIAR